MTMIQLWPPAPVSSIPSPWLKASLILTSIIQSPKNVIFRPLMRWLHPPAVFHIITDDLGRWVGIVVLIQDGFVILWHSPTGTRCNFIQVLNSTLQVSIRCPCSILSNASGIIICYCKSQVQDVSHSNSADSSVFQLQVATAELIMSKSILNLWAQGHNDIPVDELLDHQGKLSGAAAQPVSAHVAETRMALIRRSSQHPPIQHERLY